MQHFNDDSRHFLEESIKCQNLPFKVATGFFFPLGDLEESLGGVAVVSGVRHRGGTNEHL